MWKKDSKLEIKNTSRLYSNITDKLYPFLRNFQHRYILLEKASVIHKSPLGPCVLQVSHLTHQVSDLELKRIFCVNMTRYTSFIDEGDFFRSVNQQNVGFVFCYMYIGTVTNTRSVYVQLMWHLTS